MANQFRNYILTISNPSHTDEEFCEYLKSLEHLKYYVFQREKGEKKETPYFQLYIEFNMGKRFANMKELFPTAHIEQRRGSKEQARKYCMKDDSRVSEPHEYGEFAEERERTDLAEIIFMAKSGATNNEINQAFPSQFFRYYKHIEFLRQQYLEDKYKNTFRLLETTYNCGSAGIGKTKYVMEKYGYENVFRITNYERGMFDAYKGQDVIVFEEFRNSLKAEEMLNLLDVYPLQLPCRYNDKTACYTRIYLMTNLPFSEQYKNIQTEQPKNLASLLPKNTVNL